MGAFAIMTNHRRILLTISIALWSEINFSALANPITLGASAQQDSQGLNELINQVLEEKGEAEQDIKDVNLLQGTLWHLAIAHKDEQDHQESMQYLLQDARGEFHRLYLAGNTTKLPSSGSNVAIEHVVEIKKAYVAEANEITVTSTPKKQTLAVASGLQSDAALALLVNFKNDPTNKPFTLEYVNQGLAETNNFFLENSYQKYGITPRSVGYYTSDVNNFDDCNTVMNGIVVSANAAATQAGIDISKYPRRIYIFPYAPNCNFVGATILGGNITWANQSRHQTVLSHELGHQIGLYHSHGLQCAPTGPLTSPCSGIEYGDNSDTMGITYGHFNAFQKERLGWFNGPGSPVLQTVTQGGSYRVENYETTSTNVKALKVLRSASGNDFTYFYLECRSEFGFDYPLPNFGDFTSGGSVHLGNTNDPNSSYLLNINSSDTSFYYAALLPSQGPFNSIEDLTAANGGVRISLETKDQTGCTFNVKFGVGCTHVNPTVVLSPGSQSASAGGTLSYTATITNNDPPSCSSSTFNLSQTVPAEFTGLLSASTLTLAQGAQGTAVLQVTSPSAAAAGDNKVSVTATNAQAGSVGGVGVANYTVTPACVRGQPIIYTNALSLTINKGKTGVFGLFFKNTDSAGCPATNFTASVTIPAGFTGGLSTTSLVLAPGQTSLKDSFTLSPGMTAVSRKYYPLVTVADSSIPKHSRSANLLVTVP